MCSNVTKAQRKIQASTTEVSGASIHSTGAIHHLGLTVSQLDLSAQFFVEYLGFKEVKRKPDYPAIFVSNGHVMLTLWQVQSDSPNEFDRKRNIGLHHFALTVDSKESLIALYDRVSRSGAEVEFPPESLGPGPMLHTIFYEPSGNRVELVCSGS